MPYCGVKLWNAHFMYFLENYEFSTSIEKSSYNRYNRTVFASVTCIRPFASIRLLPPLFRHPSFGIVLLLPISTLPTTIYHAPPQPIPNITSPPLDSSHRTRATSIHLLLPPCRRSVVYYYAFPSPPPTPRAPPLHSPSTTPILAC